MDTNISISVLARCAAAGSTAHMGSIARVCDAIPGEVFLRNLVTTPAATVSALCNDDTWPSTETRIVAELASAPDKPARDSIKLQIPALVPGRFKADERKTTECIGRQIIGHDFDRVVAESFDAACDAIRALLPDRFLAIHTTATFRNDDGTWRLRVFEILDREATPSEWEERVKPHMRSLGEHDPSALDAARLLYMPITTAGYRFYVFEGPRTVLGSLPVASITPQTPKAPTTPSRATEPHPSADRSAMRRAKAAKLLGDSWPADGSRHEAKKRLAGALWHMKVSEVDALAFLRDVYGHVESKDGGRLENADNEVASTYRRGADGKRIDGWPSLSALVDPGIVNAARGLLAFDAFEERYALLEARGEATTAEDGNPLGFEFGAWDVEPPPVDFLVDGLVPRGSVGMLFGRANALKTWILYGLGIAVASGQPWLGRFVTSQAKVGIVDIETGRGNVRRRLFMLRAGSNPRIGAVAFPNLKPNDRRFWMALDCYGFELVIVDSLRKANPGANENDSAEAILPLELAAEFSERTGCAVLFAHHAQKASDDGWPQFRGSGAIEDQVDVSFAVRKTDITAERKTVEIRCDKPGDMRTPEPFTVAVTFDDEARLVTLRHVEPEVRAGAGAEPGEELQAAIRMTLQTHGRVSGIRALAKTLGKQAAKVGAELAILVERREVLKDADGYQLDDDARRAARVLAFVEQHGHDYRYGAIGRIARAARVTPHDVERMVLDRRILQVSGQWATAATSRAATLTP